MVLAVLRKTSVPSNLPALVLIGLAPVVLVWRVLAHAIEVWITDEELGQWLPGRACRCRSPWSLRTGCQRPDRDTRFRAVAGHVRVWRATRAAGQRAGGVEPVVFDGIVGNPNDYYKMCLIARADDAPSAREVADLADALLPRVAEWYAA
jgi:hypothetical protein